MALVSPGVQVTVIDESFYTPAEPGTTPLIVVATAENKINGSGTATAQGTLKANAGKAFRMTSQRDIVDFFGVPFFEKTPSNTPIHGSERNEYGLLAAYSFMGVSSSAFIVRANIDLNQLEGTAAVPGAEATDGAWWLDTNDTAYGIQEWNGALPSTTGGQKFTTKFPIILTSDDSTKIDSNEPKGSVGSIGDYAIVWESQYDNLLDLETKESAKLYYKSPGNSNAGVDAGQWVLVGSNDWCASHPAVLGTSVDETLLVPGEQFRINGTPVATAATVAGTVANINAAFTGNGGDVAGVTAKNVNGKVYIYSDGSTESTDDSSKSGNVLLEAITTGALGRLGLTAGNYFAPALQMTPHTDVPTWKGVQGTPSGTNPSPRPTGSLWIKTTEPGGGARVRAKRWNSANGAWVAYEAPIYNNGSSANYYLDRSGGGARIAKDTLYTQANPTEHYSYRDPDTNTEVVDSTLTTAEFKVYRRTALGAVSAISDVIALGTLTNTTSNFYRFNISQSIKGSVSLSQEALVQFTASAVDAAVTSERIASAINAAEFFDSNGDEMLSRVQASVSETNELVLTHLDGGDIRLTDIQGSPIGTLFTAYNSYANTGTANFFELPAGATEGYVISGWEPLSAARYSAQNSQPLNEPTDGQLWYFSEFSQVDIMVHNGNTWAGYRHSTAFPSTDAGGPVVSASQPGTEFETHGQLWVSTADLENFPTIYRWNNDTSVWDLVDKTDQVTEDGILFADARWGVGGDTEPDYLTPISELALSNYLDPDAPDAALYPKGMLLWNLRRSGGNVKKYNNNYIDQGADNPRFDATNSPLGNTFVAGQSMAGYATDRWTTFSGNNEDGSGSFGRKAQRKVVQAALKSVIDTSEEIRDEERRNFNLIACPGYPETFSNLINLNIDRGLTAFVIGDSPLRLKSDATSLINWGTNAALVTDNGDDGIVSFDEYSAVYYPNGFTTDLGGNNAVVPSSHMMLRTYALSDQVSFPWFAPAGTRRGGITNATAVGYIDAATGEFQTVALNEGTRDVLYDLKVNPIPFFVGVGLVAYGQKTRARNASALDRINVARLIVYLRSQLNKLARPYIFEPNDQITRDEIKGAVESLLLELVGLRALYDFAVVCDESNNTPSRVDRNELWVDIAIEPVKAVEFIYIPLRIKNTGEI